MSNDIVGIPTDDEALAAVVGGDREYGDEEKQQVAQKLKETAIAHEVWRSTLPFEQQIALRDTPSIFVPDGSSDKENASDNGDRSNAGV